MAQIKIQDLNHKEVEVLQDVSLEKASDVNGGIKCLGIFKEIICIAIDEKIFKK